jgi:hypothetical protein
MLCEFFLDPFADSQTHKRDIGRRERSCVPRVAEMAAIGEAAPTPGAHCVYVLESVANPDRRPVTHLA